MEFRNLKAQYKALAPQIDAAVSNVMKQACFIGGKPIKELESALCEYVGCKHCITCGNGTDALQLALMAWGIGEGDAVIVPDFTFFSSGEVVSAVGATPVFIDVDARTYNIDPNLIEPACKLAEEAGLTPRAVVAVDLFGLPADYPSIRPICDKLGLKLLEDGAQGFGGSIEGKKACSFGDISITSFFPAKPLGCYGDGGAIFTDNDDWAALLRSYAVHGKGTMKYDNVRIGMNSRLDTIQAAILQVKLDAFAESELDAVNDVANEYTHLFNTVMNSNDNNADASEKNTVTLPYIPQTFRSSWAQYTIQLSDTSSRNALQVSLREQNIPTMVYYPKPMHEQKAFEGRCLTLDDCPVTKRLCNTVLSLPMGPYVQLVDVRKVVEACTNSGYFL